MDTSEGFRCLDQQLVDTPCDRDRMCQTGYCDPDSSSCQEEPQTTTSDPNVSSTGTTTEDSNVSSSASTEFMNATTVSSTSEPSTESNDTNNCNMIDMIQLPFVILLTFLLIQL